MPIVKLGVLPVSPCLPVLPLGIPKLILGFSLVPLIEAVAWLPSGKVSIFPTPKTGISPLSPLSPFGILKLITGFSGVPVIVTFGVDPAGNPLTVPTVILGVLPISPLFPFSPCLAAKLQSLPDPGSDWLVLFFIHKLFL